MHVIKYPLADKEGTKMDKKIQVAVCGYGNLGKGVESEIAKNPDMELAAIFTRRKPVDSLNTRSDAPVVHIDDALEWKDKVDVMILCGGSKIDLPQQGPLFAKEFNTVDSFDTHAKAPEYFAAVDNAAKEGGNISVISVGWDPGLFSLMRLCFGAVLPEGKTYSFWGEGVSQGHGEAIRTIDGVEDAVQYTIPVASAMERVRRGENPELSSREKHERLCYVVAASGADTNEIENKIITMPDYYADYNTTVHFITLEEMKANHSELPHGGNVIHIGRTGRGNKQTVEFSLKLDSNPEFTSSILIVFARAAFRLSAAGETGARTIFDIPPKLLAAEPEELIKGLL